MAGRLLPACFVSGFQDLELCKQEFLYGSQWHFDCVLWHPRPFFMPSMPRAAAGGWPWHFDRVLWHPR
ncbi:MAG: hypothetical protein IIY46_00415, partial [Lachnospiraceae bacterium]|nr:hypothetical protein [Lachnospiraceae bacterium]